jgi:hypothetical protein
MGEEVLLEGAAKHFNRQALRIRRWNRQYFAPLLPARFTAEYAGAQAHFAGIADGHAVEFRAVTIGLPRKYNEKLSDYLRRN